MVSPTQPIGVSTVGRQGLVASPAPPFRRAGQGVPLQLAPRVSPELLDKGLVAQQPAEPIRSPALARAESQPVEPQPVVLRLRVPQPVALRLRVPQPVASQLPVQQRPVASQRVVSRRAAQRPEVSEMLQVQRVWALLAAKSLVVLLVAVLLEAALPVAVQRAAELPVRLG
jgi:hypothetical protein